MEKYKLIALDLDGTLLNSEKEITKQTKESLLKAQELGIKVVLASGRPTKGLMKEAKELELDKYNGILLSYNGGRVVSYVTDEVIYEKTIQLDEAKEVLEFLKQFNVTIMIVEDDILLRDGNDDDIVNFEAGITHLKTKKVEDMKKYIKFNPNKILIAAEPEYLKEVSISVRKKFENKMSICFSTPFYLEVMPKGVDKAEALKKICKRFDIKQEEVIAFGDGENDMSMLEYAGLSVAMENACIQLKKVADEVTKSNDYDGIAATLEKYGVVKN